MPSGTRSATDLKPHLQRCGYGDERLAAPFDFGDVSVPLVGFAGKPWDSWSACIAAVDSAGDSRESARRVSTLGAPTVFVCDEAGIDWWAMGPVGPKDDPRPRRIAWQDVGAALEQERESLLPSRIYSSKLRKAGSLGEQLWFFDAGLMPAVERRRGAALTRLVEQVIGDLRRKLGSRLTTRQAQEDTYRTVFWLLAAKILRDKRVPNFRQIDLANVDEVFERIGRHHGVTDRLPPFGKSGRPAIDAAAERIAGCGSLADVSSESLAHVYENALIDKTAGKGRRRRTAPSYDIRKELGIHSTPSVLIHHMLAQLWPLIEEIPRDQRHVFEPACGHAPFLTASMRWLRDWGGAGGSGDSHGYLRSHLHGLEADPFALELAKLGLTLADEPHGNRWNLTRGDMFEQSVLAKHAAEARILLANPPYERFTEGQRAMYKRDGTPITARTKAVEMLQRALPALPQGAVFGVVVPQGTLHDNESRPVREFLRDQCELTEIDVFADNLFEHSDHEVAVLMGRRRRPAASTVKYRRVRERGMAAFKERLAFSCERTVKREQFSAALEAKLFLPDLPELWEYLSGNSTLADIAKVGQGFSFERSGLIDQARTLGRHRAVDAVPAFLDGVRRLSIWETPPQVWLSPTSTPVRPWRSGGYAGKPQVLVNYVRAMRGPWRIKALLDKNGRAVLNTYSTIRPAGDAPPIEFYWAVLNSPIANGFAYCQGVTKHIYDTQIASVPLPDCWRDHVSPIVEAAKAYLRVVTQPGRFQLGAGSDAEARAALLRMDAAVLRAYDLPPRLERQLLDLFTDVERKGVGCEFRGYYPPGLDAYVPLHELISEEYARSTLGRFRGAPRDVSPETLAALRAASEPPQEPEERRRRYAHLSTLLDEWANEEDGFDSRVGPLIEQALRDSAPRHFAED